MSDMKKAYGTITPARPTTSSKSDFALAAAHGGEICEACGGAIPSELDEMAPEEVPEPTPEEKLEGFLSAVTKGMK